MIDRRTVLKGMLGGALVTIGLPRLGRAQEGPFPRRFGVFFWGNGMIPQRWTPTGEGRDWQLSEQLEPLAALKDEISVVSGMRVAVPNIIPHFSGAGGILSGAPLIVNGDDHTFSLPSVDQVVAQKLGESTRFRSLEFGAEAAGGLSYSGPDGRNPPETDPRRLFDRVFGGGFRKPGETVEPDPTLRLRRSVLDAVLGDISRLKGRVGKDDKLRLDQHFEGIRALEKRLAKLEEDPPALAACDVPGEPLAEYPDIEGRPQIAEKNEMFCEIAAMAFACDQTRVFTNVLTYPVNNILFPGLPAGHHQLTHDEPLPQPYVHSVVLQCMEAFACQLEALRRVPEGDGTLLDHCVILGTSDVSLGQTHSFDEFPLVIAGGKGAVKQGIHYRSPSGENASKVMLSLIRAVGLDLPAWGAEEGRVSDGLGAIEV